MARFWPTADTNPENPEYILEYARIWKNMPKVVFSKTLEEVGTNARLVRENIAEEVMQLKSEPGGYMSAGGADLARSFMQLGLIDEYQLYIHPVVLGGGTPMFGALPRPVNLRLVETHTFSFGVIFLRYQPASEG